MKALSTKTLFISLLLSAVPSAMQAEKEGTDWAGRTLGSISSCFTSLKSDAMSCFEKVGPYLEERAKNWSTSNSKTVSWLNDNPKKTFGLVGAAAVIAVGVAYDKFTYLFKKVQGNNSKKYVCGGTAVAALYTILAYKGYVYSFSEMKNSVMSFFSKFSKGFLQRYKMSRLKGKK